MVLGLDRRCPLLALTALSSTITRHSFDTCLALSTLAISTHAILTLAISTLAL